MGNAPNAGYWLIALNLQREEGLQPLTDEIDEAVVSWKQQNPDQNIEDHLYEFISTAKLPLLTSTIQETLRYTTSVTPFRRVIEPMELGGYQFDRDDEIVCVTRSVHFDEEIHGNAREYDPRRYMADKKFGKDGKIITNHSMVWGGGVSMCEGRCVDLSDTLSPDVGLIDSTFQAFRDQGTQSVYGFPSHAVHFGD
jgi:cytochrome P450